MSVAIGITWARLRKLFAMAENTDGIAYEVETVDGWIIERCHYGMHRSNGRDDRSVIVVDMRKPLVGRGFPESNRLIIKADRFNEKVAIRD